MNFKKWWNLKTPNSTQYTRTTPPQRRIEKKTLKTERTSRPKLHPGLALHDCGICTKKSDEKRLVREPAACGSLNFEITQHYPPSSEMHLSGWRPPKSARTLSTTEVLEKENKKMTLTKKYWGFQFKTVSFFKKNSAAGILNFFYFPNKKSLQKNCLKTCPYNN